MTEIAIVSYENPATLVGGVERHTVELARELSRRGIDVRLVTRRPTPDVDVDVVGIDLPLPRIGPMRPHQHRQLNLHAWDRRVARACRSADLVHGHQTDAAALAGRRPLVTTLHTPIVTDEPSRAGIRGHIQRRLQRRETDRLEQLAAAGPVVSVSDHVANRNRDAHDVETTAIIPNAYEPPPSSDEAPTTDSIRRMLYLGRLEAPKRVGTLLTAMRRLSDAWRLDIAGAGFQLDELEERARDLGVDDRTTIHGYVPERKKHRLLERADVLALPSTSEGQPIVLLEAIAHGTPVVVSRLDWLPRELRGAAIEADPTDPSNLVQAIARATKITPARDKVPSWDDVADRLLEIYTETTA